MELALFFYAAGIADMLGITASVLGIVGACIIAFTCFVCTVEELWGDIPKGALKKGIIVTVILGTVAIFTPSKETMYTMAAAYGVQSAAENPNVQRVAGKSLQLLEGKLDEYLKADKK